jgi:bleomycin hydrolase
MWEGGPNDNHAVAIVGMGHDKRGVRYFVAKNSWGTNNPTSGFFFIEESYLKKHTALVMSCSF